MTEIEELNTILRLATSLGWEIALKLKRSTYEVSLRMQWEETLYYKCGDPAMALLGICRQWDTRWREGKFKCLGEAPRPLGPPPGSIETP